MKELLLIEQEFTAVQDNALKVLKNIESSLSYARNQIATIGLAFNKLENIEENLQALTTSLESTHENLLRKLMPESDHTNSMPRVTMLA